MNESAHYNQKLRCTDVRTRNRKIGWTGLLNGWMAGNEEVTSSSSGHEIVSASARVVAWVLGGSEYKMFKDPGSNPVSFFAHIKCLKIWSEWMASGFRTLWKCFNCGNLATSPFSIVLLWMPNEASRVILLRFRDNSGVRSESRQHRFGYLNRTAKNIWTNFGQNDFRWWRCLLVTKLQASSGSS